MSKYTTNKKIITRSGIILINKHNEILLVHQIASEKWGLPKGKLLIYENIKNATIRELKEETG